MCYSVQFVQALHRMVPGHEYMELVVAMYDSMSVRAIPTTARSQSLCKFTQSFTDAGLPVPLPSLLLVVDTCLLAKDYEDAVWAWIRLLSTKTGDAILSQSHSEQLACLFLDSGSLSATQPVDALRSHVDTIVFVVTAAQSLPRLSLSEETLRRIVNAVETLGDTCVGKWWKEARLLRLRCPSPTP